MLLGKHHNGQQLSSRAKSEPARGGRVEGARESNYTHFRDVLFVALELNKIASF